ncbi:Type I site-specific deoxyribonuclease, methylase subunit [Mycoavidus cysteinexigens]|uniref:Type I site-specific deoxyribonuclease, methylase subunit n=1 Tax=Mycoavidus cysteinexigens TaxID=1553431 RepID=A0A2Z6EWN5_9BURK|nr:type I restriction-modification system subunit M [Mycoavidus cysteinexigens]BBE09884.1 Type I site-specific deoxyribonuclease, methylase subunit [Mycoavidus cysteinexigens]
MPTYKTISSLFPIDLWKPFTVREKGATSKEGFNLNVSRYISTTQAEEKIDLKEVHQQLGDIEKAITKARDKHNEFLKELGLPLLP